MEGSEHAIGLSGVAWRLGATLLLVFLNGFFVAAEFALVKVRRPRVVELAKQGRTTAKVTQHILEHLDRYLSACQLGITLASLALGALGEPAVAALIVAGLTAAGVTVEPSDVVIRFSAIALAFATITILHMTVGEQAPKMWALRKAQATALQTSIPLRIFTLIFWPFINLVNSISNAMLRAAGMNAEHGHEAVPTRAEIRQSLILSADAGHISERSREIAENVFRVVDMRVRHILVPRVDVVQLLQSNTPEDNLKIMRESGHTRFPYCNTDLDGVVGIVHAKDVFARGGHVDAEGFEELARPPLFIPDFTSLGEFTGTLQREGMHVALVVDEHGSTLGLAFLEDAIEEVMGPIIDEFDEPQPLVKDISSGVYEISGGMPLPQAAAHLGIDVKDSGESTVGGHVMNLIGRMPSKGDEVTIGHYSAKIIALTRRGVVARLRFESLRDDEDGEDD